MNVIPNLFRNPKLKILKHVQDDETNIQLIFQFYNCFISLSTDFTVKEYKKKKGNSELMDKALFLCALTNPRLKSGVI